MDPSLEQAMSEWQDKQSAGKPIQIIQAGGVAPDSSEVVVKRAAPASSIQGSGYTPGQMFATVVGNSQTEQLADMLSAIAQGVQTGIQFVGMERQEQDRARQEQYRKNEELFRKDKITANGIILGEVSQYTVGDKVFDIPENATELERQKAALQFMSGINYDWDSTGWMQSQKQNYLLELGRSIDVDERQLDSRLKEDEKEWINSFGLYLESKKNEYPNRASLVRDGIFEEKVPGMGEITFGQMFTEVRRLAAQGQELSLTDRFILEYGLKLEAAVIQETEDDAFESLQSELTSFLSNFLTTIDYINNGGNFIQALEKMELAPWLRSDVEGFLDDPSIPNLEAMMFRMATSDKDGNPISLSPEVERKIKNKIGIMIGQNNAELVVRNAIERNRNEKNQRTIINAQQEMAAGNYTGGLSRWLSLASPRDIPNTFNNIVNSVLTGGIADVRAGLAESLSYDGLTSESAAQDKLLRYLAQDPRFSPYIRRTDTNHYTIIPERAEEWNAVIADIISGAPKYAQEEAEAIRRIIANASTYFSKGKFTSTGQATDYQVQQLAKHTGLSESRVMELFESIAKTSLEELNIDYNEKAFKFMDLVKIGSAFLFPVSWGSAVNSEFFEDEPIDFDGFSINIGNVKTESVIDALFLRSLSAVRTLDEGAGGRPSTIPGTSITLKSSVGQLHTDHENRRESSLDQRRAALADLLQVYREHVGDPYAGKATPINPNAFVQTMTELNIPSHIIDAVLPDMMELYALGIGRSAVIDIIKEQDEKAQALGEQIPGATRLFDIMDFPTNTEYFIDPRGYKNNQGFYENDELSGDFNVTFDPNTGKLTEESSIKVFRRLVHVQRTFSRANNPDDPNWASQPEGKERIEESQAIIDRMFEMADKLTGMNPNNPNFRGHQLYILAMLDMVHAIADDPESNLYGLSSPDRLRMLAGAENSQFAALLVASANPRTTLPIIARTHAALDATQSSLSSRISLLALMDKIRTTSSSNIAQGASVGTVIIKPPRNEDTLTPSSAYLSSEISSIINMPVSEQDIVDSLERIVIAPMARGLGFGVDDIGEMVLGFDSDNNPIKWSDLSASDKMTYGLTLLPRIDSRVLSQSVELTIKTFNETFKNNPTFAQQFFGNSGSEAIDNYWRSVVSVAAPGLSGPNLVHYRLSPSGESLVTPERKNIGTQTFDNMQHKGITYKTMPIVNTPDGRYSGSWISRNMPRRDLTRVNNESVDGATFIWNAYVNPQVREALLGVVRQSSQSSGNPIDQKAIREFNDYLNQRNITFGDAIEKMADLNLHPQSAAVREAIAEENNARPDGSWKLNKSVREKHPLLLNLNSLSKGELPALTLKGLVLIKVTDDMFGGEVIRQRTPEEAQQGRFTFGGY